MLLRLLRLYLRPYRNAIIVVVLLQFVQSLANLYLPTLNAEIIDNGVVKGDPGYILRSGGVMLGVTVVQVACAIGAVYFGARTAMALGRDVRGAVFHHVQGFSAREVGHFGTPTLITRTTNDVQQIQMLVLLSFTMMVSAPIIGVGSVILALKQDVPLSSLLVIIVPVLALIVGLIVSRMRPMFRLMQKRIDRINQVLREQISGVRVIRAFVRDDWERERFGASNTELFGVSLGVGRLMAFMFPSVMLVVNLASIATLWFGGHLVASGGMQIGALTAFLSYLVQVLMAVMMATFMFLMVPRAEACAERVEEVLGTPTSVLPPIGPMVPEKVEGRIELRGVDFHYPGAEAPVLRGINLVAGRGTTAVIGSTGSGKTTLLNLLTRLFDATAGEVLLDGVDVRRLEASTLSRLIGVDRSARTFFPAPSPPTSATAAGTPATRNCGRPSRSPRPVRSWRRCRASSRRRSPRGAPTSPGGSGSGSPSPGRSCTVRRFTFSMTRSRPWTTGPTPPCGPLWAGTRPVPPW